MRFHKPVKFFILGIAIIAVVSLVLYIPIWQDDSRSRRERIVVHDLISVGQNLNDAQDALTNAGFELMYEEPITPTIDESYLSQLVVVGNPVPNKFESFAYAAGLSWMPFTHSESAYVIIQADLDGTITRIE